MCPPKSDAKQRGLLLDVLRMPEEPQKQQAAPKDGLRGLKRHCCSRSLGQYANLPFSFSQEQFPLSLNYRANYSIQGLTGPFL